MSVEIAWKQNILVTEFHLLKSLLVVFGFGLQAFVCGFSRQNINSVPERIYNPITAMGFTFQLDNTKTLPAPHCRNGSCRYVRAIIAADWKKNDTYFIYLLGY